MVLRFQSHPNGILAVSAYCNDSTSDGLMVAEFLQNADYCVYTAEFRSGLVVISKGTGYITVSGDIKLGVTVVAS